MITDGKFLRGNMNGDLNDLIQYLQQIQAENLELTSAEAVDDFLNGEGIRVLGVLHDEERTKDSDYRKFQDVFLAALAWPSVTVAQIVD